MHIREIILSNSSASIKINAKFCDTFWSKFKGLMLQKFLNENEGLLLVESRDSIINTSIHMLFMFFDITVIWINSDFKVVDKILAKKWFPFYFPHQPAKYILECHPCQIEKFQINETVNIQNV